MMREPTRRPRRIPRTPEEVSNFIAYRKTKQLLALQKFKRSVTYKVMNVFNITCIFVYFELLFCFFGPCHYQKHYTYNVIASRGERMSEQGKGIVSEIDLYGVNGRVYKLMVNDFIEVPDRKTTFLVGKDFLLQKELKAVIQTSDTAYRLFSASSVLFLSVFVSFICFAGYHFNLNENAYSLYGLTTLNILNMIGILLF